MLHGAPSAYIEGLITSARYSIGNSMKASYDLEELRSSTDSDGSEMAVRVHALTQIAASYDHLEYLWGECLWNALSVYVLPEEYVIRSNDLYADQLRAVGEARHEGHIVEFFGLGLAHWRKWPVEERRNAVSRSRVVDMDFTDSRTNIFLGPGDANAPSPPLEFLTRVYAQELYFESVLSEELPNYPGLSLNIIIAAWSVLSPIGLILSDRLEDFNEPSTSQALADCSFTFNRSDLTDTLIAALGLDRALAEQILELLTFSGSPREDLWIKPLVPIDGDRVGVVLAALASTNLLRAIEKWMKDGGLSLDTRGKAYEHLVRQTMVSRNKLPDCEVFGVDLTLHAGASTEEIDLVVRLGNTIIVGETKCSVQPSEPIEYHNYFEVLNKAARQASRKAAFVRKNLSALQAKTSLNVPDTTKTRVLPLVVTNLALGAGHSLHSVPVVDLLILTRFFDEGEVFHQGYHDDQGQIVSREKTRLYDSETDAEQNLEGYLREPPQLLSYKKYLSPVLRPIMTLSNNDKPAFHLKIKFDPPEVQPLP